MLHLGVDYGVSKSILGGEVDIQAKNRNGYLSRMTHGKDKKNFPERFNAYREIKANR